jgi:hypothetical protein
MDVETVAKAALAIGAPLATVIRLGGRQRRLRNDIRENLALVEDVEKHDLLRNYSLASGWLQGRIALDVARLTGQQLDNPKKPINKGSLVFGLILTLAFAAWTYSLNRDAFVWYSVFPGVVAVVCGLAVVGMFTDREVPQEDDSEHPPGAVRAPTETASERIATSMSIAASGGADDRLEEGGQADVVLRFLKLMQLGAYEAGLALADENWARCRVHAWLWNNQASFGDDPTDLSRLAEEMLRERNQNETWRDFLQVEASQFVETWGSLDFDQYGIASRRRRISADLDMVILAPVGSSGGYFVLTATALPNAFTFLVTRTSDGWRVSNHLGIAPPVPAWPPVWWVTDDPFIAALPEDAGEAAASGEASSLEIAT